MAGSVSDREEEMGREESSSRYPVISHCTVPARRHESFSEKSRTWLRVSVGCLGLVFLLAVMLARGETPAGETQLAMVYVNEDNAVQRKAAEQRLFLKATTAAEQAAQDARKAMDIHNLQSPSSFGIPVESTQETRMYPWSMDGARRRISRVYRVSESPSDDSEFYNPSRDNHMVSFESEQGLNAYKRYDESVGNRMMRIYPTTRPSVQDIIIRHAHADESDLCKTGKRQSPINIELDVVNKKLPVISWRITNAAEAKFRRMSAGSGPSEMLIREGNWKMNYILEGHVYELDLMYIHTPSEHRIASQRFEMELQLFLHSKSTSTQIAFAVVFALEEKSTPQVHALSETLYRAASLGSSSIRLDFGLLSLEILSQTQRIDPTATNAESYFTYDGSRTRKPCTENVRWIVLKNPLPISRLDLQVFREFASGLSRDTQPLNGREVESRERA